MDNFYLLPFNIINYIRNSPFAIYAIGFTTAGWLLICKWLAGGVCKSSARLDGKTVIITGGNTGIGKETALDLSRRGARVIIGCRDMKKAEKAVNDIRMTTGNVAVLCKKLDLASFKSIQAFADEILKSEPQIHILINNAGLAATPKGSKTEEGYEMQFGVNHLGHFLLTSLLLDRIKSSSPARIINVSSMAYKSGKIHFDDINLEKKYYNPFVAYCQSKLANVLFTLKLSKHLEGTSVTTYCLHPGVVHTELGRYMGSSIGLLVQLIYYCVSKAFYKTAKQGAQTTIYCAIDEKLSTESGYYYNDCQREDVLPKAKDEAAAKKLWELSERLTKIDI